MTKKVFANLLGLNRQFGEIFGQNISSHNQYSLFESSV